MRKSPDTPTGNPNSQQILSRRAQSHRTKRLPREIEFFFKPAPGDGRVVDRLHPGIVPSGIEESNTERRIHAAEGFVL
jgi:hypothetical protein